MFNFEIPNPLINVMQRPDGHQAPSYFRSIEEFDDDNLNDSIESISPTKGRYTLVDDGVKVSNYIIAHKIQVL